LSFIYLICQLISLKSGRKINLEFFNLDEIHFYSKGIHKVNGQLELLFLENKVEFNFINQNDVMLSGSSDLVRIAEIGPVKIDT